MEFRPPVEDEQVLREDSFAAGDLFGLDGPFPAVVRLPAAVSLEEWDLHDLLEMPTIPLPLVERRELDDLLRPTTHAVRHAGFRNGVVVPRVDVGKGDNLQVVRVPRCAAAVRNVHVRKFVVCELGAQHFDEPERIAPRFHRLGGRTPGDGVGFAGRPAPGEGAARTARETAVRSRTARCERVRSPASSGCRAMIQRLGRRRSRLKEKPFRQERLVHRTRGGGLRRAEERVSGMKA